MDFSRFKPGQLACITTLDKPLVVSAGAGSGKTFTLTQRVAWALMEGSAPDGGAFLDGIEQVMAITFTEKAAGEIKSRVKSTLRAEGMAEEALKVDDAWISTIHGMCSRILRMHAVELGIDPSFAVLDPARADELMRASVAEVLDGANEFVAPEGLDALFSEFPARSSGGFGSGSVEDMLIELLRVASSSPLGCDCLCVPPRARDASTLARLLAETIEEAHEAALSQKSSASRDTWLLQADEYKQTVDAYLAARTHDAKGLLSLCAACPWPSGRFGSKEYKAVAAELQARCAEIIQEARCLLAEPLLEDVLGVARSAFDVYRRAKRERGVLDNDDLLIQAARALCEHEGIAAEFAHKFKLVMVDEFQDTDQLQVDMISRMAGEGGCRLCTVGDAQQSIYRFRGADVEVYKRHLGRIRAANPEGLIELPDNFRSHRDVLAFVDRIFEQKHVFGDEFMSLAPSRFESSVKAPYKGSDTRVSVLLTTYPARSGIASADVTRFEARRIARRFSELREAGHAAGDMVVLLGKMTRADVFAEALREASFACVIAGGSIFSSAPEVLVMQRLAEVIANPHATSALFEVLSSDMFVLSADDFIVLSTCFDEERKMPRRRGIDVGFSEMARLLENGSAQVSANLVHAVRVVENLASRAGREPVSAIMAKAVEESGWLSRLELLGAEGQSVAGNIFKAIRIVESIEQDGACGPSSVAFALSAHIATAKEAPGALSAQGGDFVRIMTVHASKGLEFPIVAVAEMGSSRARSSSFSCSVIEGVAYVGLSPSRSLSGFSSSSPVVKAMDKKYGVGLDENAACEEGSVEAIRRACSPMARREAVRSYEAEQDLQERRRLLYVALTRAKEALVFSMASVRSGADADESGITQDSGIYDDVRSALFGLGDIPSGISSVDFGGSMPALIERVDTDASDYESFEEEAGASDDGDSSREREQVDIPFVPAQAVAQERPCSFSKGEVASYSMLAAAHGCDEEASRVSVGAASVDGALDDEDEAFWSALCQDLLRDADKATDLGTAFHLLAQQSVCMRKEGDSILSLPTSSRIDAVMRTCALRPSARGRIEEALGRWIASDVALRCAECEVLVPEMPFFISLDGVRELMAAHAGVEDGFDASAMPRYLEGSIDLFACEKAADASRALIVDYKTGGLAAQDERSLREKHALQASCYSYAVLMQGYEEVEAVFVRVEQPDRERPHLPQTVRYVFGREDVGRLERRIADACQELLKARP